MLGRTVREGTLLVATAFPDPPFDFGGDDDHHTGFDVELMRAICRHLELKFASAAYLGADFNGIFDGLSVGAYDAVISGTTITPERAAVALFSQPYLTFNQGVAVNRERTPHVSTVAGLRGLRAGIQRGNTSDIVARKLVADGILAGITYYPYSGIADALSDLEAGRIGCLIKLFPVISFLVKDRPALHVPLQVPTHEQLGIAFAKSSTDLCAAVDSALNALRSGGELRALVARFFPPPASA